MIALAAMLIANLPIISPVFQSHMVLQRDRPIPVWGWAGAGDKVQVRLDTKQSVGVAGRDGKWMVKLPPMPAGGPHRLVVDGPQKIELDDVWIGDVWICSGQSNMEFGLTMAKDGNEDAAKADQPMLRLFLEDRAIAREPLSTASGTWKVCTPKTVTEGGWGGFSAVGYHFGVDLQKELHVPIGLIEAAWGGTSGEAWTGREALAPTHEFDKELSMLDAEEKTGAPEIGTYAERWMLDNDEGTKGAVPWYSPDYSDDEWTPVTPPTSIEDRHITWYRAAIDLPADFAPGDGYLHLGNTAGMDTVWVNGKRIGDGAAEWERVYPCKGLHPGRNVLAVRVMYCYGGGGFWCKPDDMFVEVGGRKIAIGSLLKMRPGAVATPLNMPKDLEPNPTVPTLLRNGMIAPLAPMAIRGVIWYQGETNVGRGFQYRKILPALISDWRRLFNDPTLSFHVVSLANWMERGAQPGDESMPELREAQALTSLHDPLCGLAMAYDVGDAQDVHPKDKTTVGRRLALSASALTYGRHVEWSGPVFLRASREGRSIRLTFGHLGGGLELREGRAFAIAGADHVWHWADAKLDGDCVVVSCADVLEPVAVRYAWQNNPPATLYNKAGLPAVPFRTDDWPLLSKGEQ